MYMHNKSRVYKSSTFYFLIRKMLTCDFRIRVNDLNKKNIL
jgi:hypothetical protein